MQLKETFEFENLVFKEYSRLNTVSDSEVAGVEHIMSLLH